MQIQPPNTMTVASSPTLTVRLANFILGIKPLFNLMKGRARSMMINRAEEMGVMWRSRNAPSNGLAGRF
jgi:hypothetical protein